jgi:hypothetical protein
MVYFKQCMPPNRAGVQQFILVKERVPHSLLHSNNTSMVVVLRGDTLLHFSECEKEGDPYKWRILRNSSSPM